MTEFDAPDCAFAAPRRASTTTPLQALTLMNHDFTIDMARFIAERARKSLAASSRADPAPDAISAREITAVFRITLARPPTEEEMDQAKSLVADHGLEALCRGILNTNELIYLD
jgi:hypothetical protein